MGAYVLQWCDLVVRWFHFVAGVSWIGTSFYFVWLDDHLVNGELWSVHGGGFYHQRKFPPGSREPLAQHLHWFKWEAYATWISGMLMLLIVYYLNAGGFLIDRSIAAITPAEAVAISLGTIVAGWVVYDLLCRALGGRPLTLGAVIFALCIAAEYGFTHLFSGRAAYIQIGAIGGTIMAANVLFVIIPGQRKMVAQLRAGEPVDPEPGRRGKQRSVHNTYFTLPVLFTMISAHYPMLYEGRWPWLTLALVAAAGIAVRYFFILSHKQRLVPGLPIAAALLLGGAAVAVAPRPQAATIAAPPFPVVHAIVAQRCAVCHSAHPTEAGFTSAPLGVLLQTPAEIRANAPRIEVQAVQSHAMPLGNITGMTDRERALLGAWIAGGAKLH